jgi:hypothetical protein
VHEHRALPWVFRTRGGVEPDGWHAAKEGDGGRLRGGQ